MQKLLSYRGTDDIRELPFGMIRVSNEALMWLRGVRGELLMAERLQYLGPEWVVLHSVLVDRFTDIDHIAIGPPGVFPINTKRLLDREVVVEDDVFRSDGWKKKFLAKSEIEARRVDSVLRRAQISATVLPIIAISGAAKVRVKGQPQWHGRNIGVAAVEDVARRLVKRQRRLEADQVNEIAEVLSDSSSWKTRSADAPPEMLAEYRRLDRGTSRFRGLIVVASFAIILASLVGFGFWFSWTVAPRVADYVTSLYIS
ncbi:hypothetical protein BH09ACT4_BH09ACT4_03010 [soil metagenome]